MKINVSYLVLAAALLALWGLRRLGMDGNTADAIVTFCMLAVGMSPSVLPTLPTAKQDAAPKADKQ